MNTNVQNIRQACNGLTFDVMVAGERGAPMVLLLHGFPQTNHTWRAELPALAEAGYFAVAPNQRGYSAAAQPEAVAQYATHLLVEDAIALITSFGYQRAHIVGHDWGGQLSWLLAAHHAPQVQTLSVLSRPHPQAFVAAMKNDPGQSERSKHHRAFQNNDSAHQLLADNAQQLRKLYTHQWVPDVDQDVYLKVLGNEKTLDAAINWYRAPVQNGAEHALQSQYSGKTTPAVECPTLYIWGDADATVGVQAARETANFVQGPYEFVVLEGVGHFITDQLAATNPKQISNLLIRHIDNHG